MRSNATQELGAMLAAFQRSLQVASSVEALQDAAAAALPRLKCAAPRELDRSELAETLTLYVGA